FSHPLPREKIMDFLGDVDVLLVVEEIDPVMETEIKSLAYDKKLEVEIHGKDLLPRALELSTDLVKKAIAKILNIETSESPPTKINTKLPRRPPVLCPGCPHRATYYSIKMALRREKIDPANVIFPTDIGCYTLGINPPFSMGDILLCMGSSAGTSNGLSKTTTQPVIAFIGDSTFYHAGIPPLINAVFNKHNFILVVLDNTITAMTGFQANPSSGFTGTREPTKVIPIEKIGKAIGVDHVEVIDPVSDVNSAIKKFQDAIKAYKSGKSVLVVSRSPCALFSLRTRGFTGKGGKYKIDKEKCINCGLCYKEFNCPAIFYDKETKKPFIRTDICTGCGVCMDICPVKAISKISESE
ncbi:MAG: thiamine pyrophosphate-dependent enzyme, partial [Candidatus Njordarchaeota archaeon]